MQKIDGVVLSDLSKEIEATRKAEAIEVAKAALLQMLREIDTHGSNVRKAEEQLEAAKKKLETAKVRYQKACEGDWSVISDKVQEEKK
jgi:outer membrane protein TolC